MAMDPLDAAMKKCGADAFVHYATGEEADMRYLTRFVMHDPFVFFKRRRQPGTIIVPQMEAERASRESTTSVMTRTQAGLPDIVKKEKDPWKAAAKMIAGQAGKNLLVSPALPAALLRALEEHGHVIVDNGTVERVRAIKSPGEIRLMQAVQKKTERAMALGISLISHATVKKGILYHNGAPLTSELVRIAMHKQLMDEGCRAVETIISCGEDTAFPHIIGSGALKPHEPIVIDMFPRDEASGYYADMTRTVSKGKPSQKITEMYEAVKEAQQIGIATIKAGVSGADVHNAVVDYFKSRGYESDTRGFIHNLGHGVGLQVHELPTVGPAGGALEAGSVVTVEPGLYYPGVGGIRLEDMGAVRARQFAGFTQFEETLIV
ncbi:peptidase M24 [Methanoregula boonei 6A8]|uniref:Peptidase M24 n=1 Tax=Methanoregula boonei (strain DSM 21154 / JCM 14090 / 6A8) TaxID=456442 RepID=A7I5J5_METB6|nr:Xaa-Pro peptidase family protein [Methanoregula boonei]ABS55006.1 peptidase M24 [Methanoregula boonei 6A8]